MTEREYRNVKYIIDRIRSETHHMCNALEDAHNDADMEWMLTSVYSGAKRIKKRSEELLELFGEKENPAAPKTEQPDVYQAASS